MGSGVQRIERRFAESFAQWGIRLPADSVTGREGGQIFEAGWHIGYIWGQEDGEEFLEYLAQHRMTDDFHRRVWASGRVEELPAPSSMFAYAQGTSEAEIKRLEDEYFARNRQLGEELRTKGLLPPEGQNLPILDINEFLRSGGMPDQDGRRAAD